MHVVHTSVFSCCCRAHVPFELAVTMVLQSACSIWARGVTDAKVNACMNKMLKEGMNVWMNKCNEWIHKRNEWMNQWMNEWMLECNEMNELIKCNDMLWRIAWMHACMRPATQPRQQHNPYRIYVVCCCFCCMAGRVGTRVGSLFLLNVSETARNASIQACSCSMAANGGQWGPMGANGGQIHGAPTFWHF